MLSRKTPIAVALALALLLASCATAPESYPPPIQRSAPPDSEPDGLGPFVNMRDANAEMYFVKDISGSLEAGSWRWAHARPELKFLLKRTEGWKFSYHLGIVEATFKVTGPVTIHVLINGQPFTSTPYEKPGDYRLEKPVPAELLKANAENNVVIYADKAYTAERDGAKLAYVLHSAGFVQ